MKFKLHAKNLPLLLAACANAAIVFAHWTEAQTGAAVALVTGLAAVLGWTE